MGSDFKAIQNFNDSGIDLRLGTNEFYAGQLPNVTIDKPGLGVDFGYINKSQNYNPNNNNNQTNLPTQSQVSSTLFIMDCQTFGIFQNQKLLKLENARAMINGEQDKNSKMNSAQNGQQQSPLIGNYNKFQKIQEKLSPVKEQINQKQAEQNGSDFSEAQLVNFVIARAQQSTTLAHQRQIQQQQQQSGGQQNQMNQQNQKTQNYQNSLAQSIIPKELPKLSDDAKRILNTVKAQKHLHMFHSKVQKLDTLVMELDYYDYKNQLLQQLFHHYGNRVLSNLVHKIIPTPLILTAKEENQILQLTKQEMDILDFQTVDEYISKIQEGHKKNNEIENQKISQKNAVFSQINDFSKDNDFNSLQKESGIQNHPEQSNSQAFQENQNSYPNSDKKIENQFTNQKNAKIERTDPVEDQLEDDQLKQTRRRELDKELNNYLEEIQHLFPKYHCKRVDGELTFLDLDHSINEQTNLQTGIDGQVNGDQKPKVKKLNFHVIVKHTRLYHALKCIKEFKRVQTLEEKGQFANEDQNIQEIQLKNQISNSENQKNEEIDTSTVVTKSGQTLGDFRGIVMGLDDNGQLKEIPLSAYNLSSELSQNSSELPKHLRNLSSFVLIKDCSILKFALYCFHVGIVSSVQQMLRQFFKHVFIVIKPGTKALATGQVQILKELPVIDVEKINKYLIQTKMRKLLQNQKLLGKAGEKAILFKRCNLCIAQNQQYCPHLAAEVLAQLNHQNQFGQPSQVVPGQYSYSGLNQAQVQPINQLPWNNKFKAQGFHQNKSQIAQSGEQDFYVRNLSLSSFKSIQDINRSDIAIISEYSNHFNSGPSAIKVEGLAGVEKTTITIVHKPYTHLDNSRIQKAFKIYNEFNQLLFKSRLHMVQNPDNIFHQGSDIGNKGELGRIYKLAGHMSVKLPRRAAGSSLGRQPIIEMLKNQRSVGQVKEQMVKFIHRILNEENGISMKFFNAILVNQTSQNQTFQNSSNIQAALLAQGISSSTQNLVNSTQGGKAELSPFKGQNPETQPFIDLQKMASISPNNKQKRNNDQSQNKSQPITSTMKPIYLVGQPTNIFKHQVGLGNNHPLIKNLMKNRQWWHHIQPKNNQGQVFNNLNAQNGQQYFVMKIDFEEAQIMWTQWRKLKLYDYMVTNSKFKADYKDLIAAIDFKNIQIINANANIGKDEQTKIEKSRNDKPSNAVASGVGPQSKPEKQENPIDNLKLQTRENTGEAAAITESNGKGARLKLNRIKSLNRNQNPSMTKGDNFSSNQERGASSDFKQLSSKNKGSRQLQRGGNKLNVDDYDGSSDGSLNLKEKKKDQLEKNKTQLISLIELKNMMEKCKRQFQKIYNRLEFNQHLNNKKALFFNMRNYYNYCCADQAPEGIQPGNLVFDTLPLTFHIKTGLTDPQFSNFESYYQKFMALPNAIQKNIWILKPGENTNRGTGIKVESDLGKIKQLVQSYCFDDQHTCILQKYIHNPLLYNRRKFDIRCFALVTSHNGLMKAYFYRDGYIRTSSKEFSMNNLTNKYVHLVNDAIQKYSEDYGKYEAGNKLSYWELQKYFTSTYPEKKINLERDIIMQVKKIVTDTVRATFHLIDAKKRLNSFELFGYDFMFDEEFRPYLIEVNSNPSLEPSNNALNKLFTQMLDNTFRIAIEPLFPPTEGYSLKKGSIGVETCPENRFDLIFDERIDGPDLLKKFEKIGKKELKELEDINELAGSEDEHEADVSEVDVQNQNNEGGDEDVTEIITQEIAV